MFLKGVELTSLSELPTNHGFSHNFFFYEHERVSKDFIHLPYTSTDDII